MDGLPGLRRGVETAMKEDVTPIKKMVGPYALEFRGKERDLAKDRFNNLLFMVLIGVVSFIAGGGMMAMLGRHGLTRQWGVSWGLA